MNTTTGVGKVVLIVLAVIGAIAVLGLLLMLIMHKTMMGTMSNDSHLHQTCLTYPSPTASRHYSKGYTLPASA